MRVSSPTRHTPLRTRDRRYAVAREFCGHTRAQHVVRFCDAWLGSAPTHGAALNIVAAHAAARAVILDGGTA